LLSILLLRAPAKVSSLFFDHTPVCGSKDSIENLMGQVDRFIDGMASRNDPDINLLLSRKPQARNDARPEVN
jgi:hypothetical protein